MSTPFHIVPAPRALRWSPEDSTRATIIPSSPPWPAPDPATLVRSNVWSAPVAYAQVWAPPLAGTAITTDVRRRRLPLLQRITRRLRWIFRR